MPPNVVTTMKRKLDEFIDDEGSYGSQRQSVLNISMCKLKMVPRRRVEPCLRRSVLILNTLKHIETELEMEGVYFTSPADATFNLTDPSHGKIDLDPLPECNSNTSFLQPSSVSFLPHVATEGPPSPMPKPVQDVENMDTSAKDTSGKTVLDLVPCKLATAEVLPCTPVSKLSASRSYIEDANNNLLPSSFASFASNSSASWSEDFSDIDISVCDVDIYSISSAMKLTPLSAEEVLHSFPNTSGHANDSYPSFINSQCGTSFRNESVMDDLDNIMQILVGM
ncbi:uncharacterized protein LOC124255397 [Haliotis rubra]|uniref:uncharacterized protein LOC124255397 n=1 Tax=Haliotis rubra TaxID=36100 RepID=UPI001EE59E2F|nr:uncharacterized protein LOC124255397 [Haliotis rubra]XP_046545263.1 uncharacterized protein LOC124255397 [Haliotis rubra]XP_046545264.1 uncharacterized protein LOC124255397 [Haliotis rubra]